MARGRSRNARGEGEKLRLELLAAANDILDETKDPAAVTVRGIAARVGVAPNAVYLHFADRDELLAAVLVDRFTEFGDRIRAAMRSTDDPLESFRRGHRAYLDFALEHPGHYRLLFGRGGVRPQRKDLADQVLTVGLAAFELCIEGCRRAIEAGVFAPDTDPGVLAHSIWVLEHGYADLAGTDAGVLLPGPDEILDNVLRAARTTP
jgi:AcrR family transcriptional regulator